SNSVLGRFPARNPPEVDAYRIRDRSRALFRQRAQALDRTPQASRTLHHPQGPSRYQSNLGARPRRGGIRRGSLSDSVEPCRQCVGTPKGAGTLAREWSYSSGRGCIVSDDRTNAAYLRDSRKDDKTDPP